MIACYAAGERWNRAWDEPRKAAVRGAFLRAERPFAQDVWRSISESLDAFTRSSSNEEKRACELAHREGERRASVDTYCFDRSFESMGALMEEFSHADAVVVEHAVRGVSDLQSLANCAQTPNAPVAPPAVSHVSQAGITKARVQLTLGEFGAAKTSAMAVVSDARSRGDKSVLVDALLALGEILVEAHPEAADAERPLQEALTIARDGQYHHQAVRALLDLVWFSELSGHLDDAAYYDHDVLALIAQAGRMAELEALELERRGVLALQRGDNANAIENAQEALHLLEERSGEASIALSRSLEVLATALYRSGRFKEALRIEHRIIDTARALEGRNHPDVALALLAIARILIAQERFADALDRTTRANDIYGRAFGSALALPSVERIRCEALTALERSTEAKSACAPDEHVEDLHDFRIANLPNPHDRAERFLRTGEHAYEQGRFKDAAASFMGGVEVLGGMRDQSFLQPVLLSAAAEAYLRLGDTRAAVQMARRSLEMLDGHEAPPLEQARIRFAAARALWEVPSERRRAGDLAVDSKNIYRQAVLRKNRLAQVDRWLSSHSTRGK
jgi:tetratricopeptide (TPR) repeat protein